MMFDVKDFKMKKEIIKQTIENKIHVIREKKVSLNRDLAILPEMENTF